MLNLLRKLRRNNMKGTYFKYAIGEIFLVVFGILIALQINTWSENRKTDRVFRSLLKEIHSGFTRQYLLSNNVEDVIKFQLTQMEQIIEDPEVFSDDALPYVIQSFDYIGLLEMVNAVNPNYSERLTNLNLTNKKQIALANTLQVSMGESIAMWNRPSEEFRREQFLFYEVLFEEHLKTLGFPLKHYIVGMSLREFQSTKQGAFNMEFPDEQIQKLRILTKTQIFRNSVYAAYNRKDFADNGMKNVKRRVLKLIKAIEDYDPDIRYKMDVLNIVGQATPTGDWTTDIPMTPLDDEGNQWTIDITLKDGGFKFRTSEEWNYNWGQSTSNPDKLVFGGTNLYLPAGRYRITVDLIENSLEHQPLD